MYKKTTYIDKKTGEILKEKGKNYHLFDEEKGLLWRNNNLSFKVFLDVQLYDYLRNKIQFANVNILAGHIYKQTNCIMVRVSKTKVKFATIEDMSKMLDTCERTTKIFIKKMIDKKVMAKRIDKVGDRVEVKYLLNPIFFCSSKWLSYDLYFTFKDVLDDYLTPWQKERFTEYGNIKGEVIVEKKDE